MDAKSRANFINSVASGANIPCPNCGTNNTADCKYCISCGSEITVPQVSANNTPAFEQAKEPEASVKVTKYVEPNNVFAKGLPEWSLEPPHVMVRRH